MKLSKVIAIPALALAAGLSLAACGSVKAPAAAPAVTRTVTAPAAAPKPTPHAPTTPAPAKTVYVRPAPAKTVYVQVPAAPAPPAQGNGLIACGSGVYAGAGTGCSLAFDVEQAYHAGGYWNQPGTSQFDVDGQFMTSASVGNPVIVTDGSGDLVQFNY